jgi:hypothetical protein
VAKHSGVSPASVDRMSAAGLIPAPVKLAGVLRRDRHEWPVGGGVEGFSQPRRHAADGK